MLIASHLSKHYATARGPVPVLDDVSLEVGAGDAVAIMGPSGCGKSTLLYILGALEGPTTGTVSLDGKDPNALSDVEQSAFRNEHIGFVFQDHLLLPQLSALDNVLAPTLVSRSGKTESERTARARDLLAAVGGDVPDALDPDAATLSHVNLNDRTVEGLQFKRFKGFSVQYHPEASPGPHDSDYLFDRFLALIDDKVAAPQTVPGS